MAQGHVGRFAFLTYGPSPRLSFPRKRESMRRLPTSGASKFAGRLSRVHHMDSRFRGNDNPRNFVGRCLTLRIDPRQSSRHLLKQRFGFKQIFCVDAFGEPVINRGEQVARFVAFTLRLPRFADCYRYAKGEDSRKLVFYPWFLLGAKGARGLSSGAASRANPIAAEILA